MMANLGELLSMTTEKIVDDYIRIFQGMTFLEYIKQSFVWA